MYCRNCGNEVDPKAKVCVKCGCELFKGNNYCKNCGEQTDPNAAVCISCGYDLNVKTEVIKSTKSKMAAGILGILLGGLGIHNFYLGYVGKGVAQLLLCIIGWFLCFVPSLAAVIWGLIEGIMILTGSINKDGKGAVLSD